MMSRAYSGQIVTILSVSGGCGGSCRLREGLPGSSVQGVQPPDEHVLEKLGFSRREFPASSRETAQKDAGRRVPRRRRAARVSSPTERGSELDDIAGERISRVPLGSRQDLPQMILELPAPLCLAAPPLIRIAE